MNQITQRILHVAGAAALAITLSSGQARAQCVSAADGSGQACYALYAGQHIDAGTVCFEVNGDSLDVTYETSGSWELEEAHLWVGSVITDMPQTRRGNPIPGQFPYASGDIAGATSHTFSLPVAELGYSCPGDDATYLAAAHAALRRSLGDGTYQTETGWSEGSPITSRGGWATFSTFALTCNCGGGDDGGGVGSCETAFARDAAASLCFLDIDEDSDGVNDFSRWGWTNGALSEGSYTMSIYAGAGQCDYANKGTYVGDLTVEYANGTATATYSTDAPYTISEVHFYAGSEILARDGRGFFTVAPGQYPVVTDGLDYVSEQTASIGGLSGDIHIVAHAVVCGFE